MVGAELTPLLGAGGVAGVIALAGLLLGGYRSRARAARQDALLRSIQKDLRALCNAAVSVGDRVNRMERRIQQLTDRQEELGSRQDRLDQSEFEGQSYNQAIKLANKGGDVDELIEVCGLTRGEAELIAMMHRLDKADYEGDS